MRVGRQLLVYFLAFVMVFTMLPLGMATPTIAESSAKIAYITHDMSNQNSGFQKTIEAFTGYKMDRFLANQYDNKYNNSTLDNYKVIIIDSTIQKNRVKEYSKFIQYLKNTPSTVITGVDFVANELGLISNVNMYPNFSGFDLSIHDRNTNIISGISSTYNDFNLFKSNSSIDLTYSYSLQNNATVICAANQYSLLIEKLKDETMQDGQIAKGNRYLVPQCDKNFDNIFSEDLKVIIRNILDAQDFDYDVNIQVNGQGSIVGKTDYTFESASTISTSVAVDEGYKLSKWTITEGTNVRELGNANPINVSVNRGATITAYVIPEGTVDVGTFKVLEVQPYISSNLYQTHELNKTAIQNELAAKGIVGNVELDQMSIEGFLTNRDQLNGKYDMIYVGNKPHTLGTPNSRDVRYGFIDANGYIVYNNTTYFAADDTSSIAPQAPNKAYHEFNGKVNKYGERYSAKDISNLKSKDLQEFIDAGFLVVFADELINAKVNGNPKYGTTNLYKNFHDDVTKDNFITTKNINNDLSSLILKYREGEFSYRDKIVMNLAPQSYLDSEGNQHYISTIGNKSLTYNFAINTKNDNELAATLYLDKNGNGIFEENERVKIGEDQLTVVPLANTEDVTISVKLASEFSGFLPWKLEVIDQQTGAKTYYTDYCVFQQVKDGSEVRTTKVLQLIPYNSSVKPYYTTPPKKPASGGLAYRDRSSLYLRTMNNLVNEGLYNIEIDEMNIYDFNYAFRSDGPGVQLNGKYDMIVIGFKDAFQWYGTIDEPRAIEAIESFIDSGQSVMLTHDTIVFDGVKTVDNYQPWMEFTKNFRDLFGQNIYQYDPFKYVSAKEAKDNGEFYTNRVVNPSAKIAGHSDGMLFWANGKGMNTTSEAYKVNDGQVTLYPFVRPQTMDISPTHTQWYQLDYENPELVTWFNLKGGYNDHFDGKNNYYVYSLGNITYSGTGHTSPGSEEQKLFINTMLKAASSGNTSPVLNLYNIENGKVYYKSVDEVTFSYIANDMDADDEFVDVEIYAKRSDMKNFNLVKSFDNVPSNELQSVTLSKSEMFGAAEPSLFDIKVIAKDKKDAMSEEICENLKNETLRSLSITGSWSNDRVLVGESNTLSGTIVPMIQGNDKGDFTDIAVKIMTNKENASKISMPEGNGWIKHIVGDNLVIEKGLGSITYDFASETFNKEKIDYSLPIDLVGADINGIDFYSVVEYKIDGVIKTQNVESHIEVYPPVINVMVNDKLGRAIKNHDVTITSGDDYSVTLKTDIAGYVTFSGLGKGAGPYTIRVANPDTSKYTSIEAGKPEDANYAKGTADVEYTVGLSADVNKGSKDAYIKMNYETLKDVEMSGSVDVVTLNEIVAKDVSDTLKISFDLTVAAKQLVVKLADNAPNTLGLTYGVGTTANGGLNVVVNNDGKTIVLTSSNGDITPKSYALSIPVSIPKGNDKKMEDDAYNIILKAIGVEEVVEGESQGVIDETFNIGAPIVAVEMDPTEPVDPTDPTKKDKFSTYFANGATGVIEKKGVGVLDIAIRPAKDTDLSDVDMTFELEGIDPSNTVDMQFVRIDEEATTLDGVTLSAGNKGIHIPNIDKRGEADTTHLVRIEVLVNGAKLGDDFNVKFNSIMGVDISTETSIPTREVKVLESLKLD